VCVASKGASRSFKAETQHRGVALVFGAFTGNNSTHPPNNRHRTRTTDYSSRYGRITDARLGASPDFADGLCIRRRRESGFSSQRRREAWTTHCLIQGSRPIRRCMVQQNLPPGRRSSTCLYGSGGTTSFGGPSLSGSTGKVLQCLEVLAYATKALECFRVQTCDCVPMHGESQLRNFKKKAFRVHMTRQAANTQLG